MNVNGGDIAWVLVSAALVMLMTPALGFFYGGLVRHKNVTVHDHAQFLHAVSDQRAVGAVGLLAGLRPRLTAI